MKKTDYNEIHQKEVKKRSITPDTYRGGNFIENDLYYVDQYQYKDSKTSQVLHFGINTYREELKEELEKHNQTQKELSVKSNNTNNYKLMSQNMSLTEHEKIVTKLAIDYLFKDNVKTVLVDVFERDKTGLVSSAGSHTVVLYNVENKKIFVIDPSNPQFSSHLANFAPSLIEVSYSDKMKIYQPPEKANEKGWVGPNLNQWRDCVDIAIKLAFGLNKSDLKPTKFEDIIDCITIKSISNAYKINDSITDQIQEKSFVKIPLRIQQKSNTNIREDFYKFSKAIKQNLVDIKNKIGLEDNYVKTLFNSDTSSCVETLKSLYSFSEATFIQMHKELEETQLEVLGKGFNLNIYDEV